LYIRGRISASKGYTVSYNILNEDSDIQRESIFFNSLILGAVFIPQHERKPRHCSTAENIHKTLTIK
jgi:hypothetical protein